MSILTRRNFILSTAATLPLAACGNGIGSDAGQRIDSRVDSAIDFMHTNIPYTRELSENAQGVLVMPLITEAGFGFGGGYGRGALRINGATVDYYSSAQATVGFQIGAQQYAHALFFMTQDALRDFRYSSGWAAGADIQYAVNREGGNLGTSTTNLLSPVIGVVFGQAGLIAGATVEGQRYTRILP
ncbi:lipid-binding SYLF domain-containing protein [Alterinioella nitratireducens]|uniref:lipid-binding SYLF domain-containing protein n=1 Tax=Alterinioella nitratireducens TaxID=2735915 RepID=UPI0015556604|nr:YSC84-related protein [Alterinioella nitratireducens]NPD18991.1 twin-arginine translocation pathway signal [Alterinioella nitratireducens]